MSNRYRFNCANGCGACGVKVIEFETSRTESIETGELIARTVEPKIVSDCCRGGVEVWDSALGVEVGNGGSRMYFVERNSARDAWARRAKDCERLQAEVDRLRDMAADSSAEDELNCAEEVLDGYAAHLDLKQTDFDCIGDYITAVVEAHRDMAASGAKDAERLDALREHSWDVRSFDMPTGAGDADIGWKVVEHHEGKPHEREVGCAYRDDPREAIDAAVAATKRGGA